MIELEARAHAESVSLTRILNRTLRAGLAKRKPDRQRARRFKQKTVSMGRPTVDLDKALALAAQLEDDAHLAALALTHGATLASCDADFSRFRSLRWENPLRHTV